MKEPIALQTKPMMTFQDAVKQCVRKYADFSGRATRAEYWWWFLAAVLGSSIAGVIDSSIVFLSGGYDDGYPFSLFGAIFGLAVLLPDLAVTARRLHDIGKTGWWQLVWVVLFVVAWIPFVVGVITSIANGLFDGSYTSHGVESEFLTLNLETLLPLIIGLLISALISLVIVIWVALWMARQGQNGPNRFGADPRALEEPAADALE